MITVTCKMRPVWRGRTRDLLTRRAACVQFAWLRWNESRPNPNGVVKAFCECDPSTGYRCDIETPDVLEALNWYQDYSTKVVERYAERLYRQHDPRITERRRSVWRAPGRRGRLRAKTAYLDAAWDAYRARHGCGETVEEHGFSNFPHRCDHRCFGVPEAKTKRIVARLARWLMWRDRLIESQLPKSVATNAAPYLLDSKNVEVVR